MSLGEQLNAVQVEVNQSNEQLEQKIKMFDADTAKKEVSFSKREGEWVAVNEKLNERRVDIAKEEERLKVKEAELSDRELDCLQWEKELKTAASLLSDSGKEAVVGTEAGDFKARLDALFEFRM